MDMFWLSFTDNDGFQGVVIGEGDSLVDVVSECWRRGCNPGGEVASQMFPPLSDVPVDHPERGEIERTYALPRWTLLSKAQLSAHVEIVRVGDMSEEERAAINATAERVCATAVTDDSPI